MRLTRYLPEGVCFSLYAIFAVLLIVTINRGDKIDQQIKTLTSLERIVPKQKTEILNTNFNSILHYDLYAQYQLEIEQLMLQLPMTSGSFKHLTTYNELTAHYMQLVTMLKTSRRIIAFSDNLSDSFKTALNSELLKFILTPTLEQSMLFQAFISQAQASGQLTNQTSESLVQHSQFIIDNTATANQLNEQLKTSSIYNQMSQEHHILQAQFQEAIQLKLVYSFLIILMLLSIFILLIKRQQKTLTIANQKANLAAEAKTLFLANMSHEIRTPLTGIIGLSELCLESDLNASQRDYLDKVLFSANSLLSIINDILDFSKIEAGKFTLECIDFEHEKAFENLKVMVGKNAENKGLELIYDLDPNIPAIVHCDPVRIGQILLNLVGNAIKFTEQGHVLIKASIIESQHEHPLLKPLTNADQYSLIEYQVQDTGIGLTAEQTGRLFGRFVQADSSTTRKYGGTGLGLSISRSLVELMQGTITVNSSVGIGTTFTVTIPVRLALKSAFQEKSYSLLKNKKLLLLEDNVITQQVIKELAAFMGMTIVISNTVQQAIVACNEQHFDIALIDWHLPNENGLDFIKQLERLGNQPAEIIICSAFDNQQMEDRNHLLKHYRFLSKPFTISKFYQTLTHQQSTIIKPKAEQKHIKIQGEINTVKPKILLVEDNRINQTIATTILKSFNLDVDLAEEGLAAIVKVKTNQYDLVLMDIQMPVMDGIEATTELRKHYNNEELVIIALTANVTEEEVTHYLSVGMNSHLCKPYNKEHIKTELEKYISISD